MKTLTVASLRELDKTCQPAILDFLWQVRLKTFFHEDNIVHLSGLAGLLDVALEELSSYAWIQVYIAEFSSSLSPDEIPAIEIVAEQFGIPLSEFWDYVEEAGGRLRQEVLAAMPAG